MPTLIQRPSPTHAGAFAAVLLVPAGSAAWQLRKR